MRHLRYVFALLAAWTLTLLPAQSPAQPVAPPVGSAALVCAYNTSVPAPTSGAFAYVQCDSTGKLITTATGGGGGTPGGTSGQIQFNSAGSFGGFTMSGDCTTVTSTGVITCTAIGGKAVTLSAAFTTTGGATTLAFGAGANTYTFPNSSDTVVTLAATQTLTGKSISGPQINSGVVPLAQTPNFLGFPGYAATNWYSDPYVRATTTSVVGVANSYYCVPVWIYQAVHIETLGIRIVGSSGGNTNGALAGAIYADIAATGTGLHRPGNFIDTTASNFVTTSAGQVSQPMLNTSDAISPGLNWLCVQTFDATVTYLAVTTTDTTISAVLGSATLTNVASTAPINSVSATGASYNCAAGTGACSAWPNFAAGQTWAEVTAVHGPNLTFQVLSIP